MLDQFEDKPIEETGISFREKLRNDLEFQEKNNEMMDLL